MVVKSGPCKPKLENVSLAQWSVANLAILYRLVAESKLHGGNILDYLSYTTKICQLVQRFTLISVLLYDREYRQLQARILYTYNPELFNRTSLYQGRPMVGPKRIPLLHP